VENEVDSVTENNDKNIQKEEKINWLWYATLIICAVASFGAVYYFCTSGANTSVSSNQFDINAVPEWHPLSNDLHHKPFWFEGIDLAMSREQESLLTPVQRNYCINKMLKYVSIQRNEYWKREEASLNKNPLSVILYDKDSDTEN
jgi:hypothetical protein